MSKQEFAARDLALCIELNEERKLCTTAQKEIWQANVRMQDLYKQRMMLRQEYYNSKQGGQNND